MSASSSGITDSDVTILYDQSAKKLASAIENKLKKKAYTIPIAPAGRNKYANILSKINHSAFT